MSILQNHGARLTQINGGLQWCHLLDTSPPAPMFQWYGIEPNGRLSL
jgi:hypothetical protein